MSYIDKTLLPEERILFYTCPHPIVFAPAVMWLIISIVLFFSGGSLNYFTRFLGSVSLQSLFGNIALLIALFYGIMSYITYISSEYGITDKRILMKIGLIRRNSLEIFLNKIESINVKQSVLGRILNYGTIVVSGTGGSKDPFPYIPDPLEFRRQVQQQIERLAVGAKTGSERVEAQAQGFVPTR